METLECSGNGLSGVRGRGTFRWWRRELGLRHEVARGVVPPERARAALFERLTSKPVVMPPEEAELAKLFTHVWRYIKFATANQLYMMADERGLDFDQIRRGLAEDYPRAADMPAGSFAAGPYLLKDTTRLAALNHNNFPVGHAAMAVNEGLPLYVVHRQRSSSIWDR